MCALGDTCETSHQNEKNRVKNPVTAIPDGLMWVCTRTTDLERLGLLGSISEFYSRVDSKGVRYIYVPVDRLPEKKRANIRRLHPLHGV